MACNDLTDEMTDVKTQTTQNAATIDALSAKITALETALASAQSAADEAKTAAAAAKQAGDNALAEAQAAKAAAATAEANAIAEAKKQVEALKAVYEAKVAEIETALAGKATQADIDAAVKKAADDAAAALAVIDAKVALKADKTEVEALVAADAAINKEIEALKEFKKLAEELHIELTTDVDSLQLGLADAQAEIEEIWAALYDEENGLFALIGGNASAISANTALIEALEAELDGFYAEVFGEGPNSIMSILGTYANQIAELQAKVDNIYGVFNSQSKSLVFVPEYTDMKATIYQYTLNGLAVNNQVVVKATYKVTPSHLAQDVADYKLMPVMFAKELKPRTRAAAEELASTNVFVTNANPNTGTFDVEAIFTYVDELDPGFGPSIAPEGWLADAAFALYLSENQAVAADGEEAPAAAPAVSNKITSSYIQVAPAKGTEIAELYVLYNPALKKEYKDLKAEELNIKMPWCEKNNARTPLAGFDVYVKNGKEYMTIAEAAELFRVPAEVITPMYFDKITYDEEECKVLAVEPDAEEEGVLARTISIVGDVTAANAKDYIGHNVAVAGNYTDVRGNDLPALDVAYSYEIDYRTVKLDLVHGDADFVAWTLDNQYALYGEDNDLTNPIDKNFDEKFGE